MNKPQNADVARRIAAVRTLRGWSRADLDDRFVEAEVAKGRGLAARLERGQAKLWGPRAAAVARILGVNTSFFRAPTEILFEALRDLDWEHVGTEQHTALTTESGDVTETDLKVMQTRLKETLRKAERSIAVIQEALAEIDVVGEVVSGTTGSGKSQGIGEVASGKITARKST